MRSALRLEKGAAFRGASNAEVPEAGRGTRWQLAEGSPHLINNSSSFAASYRDEPLPATLGWIVLPALEHGHRAPDLGGGDASHVDGDGDLLAGVFGQETEGHALGLPEPWGKLGDHLADAPALIDDEERTVAELPAGDSQTGIVGIGFHFGCAGWLVCVSLDRIRIASPVQSSPVL